MRKNIYIYLFTLALLLFTVSSCADDSIGTGFDGGEVKEIKGTLSLNLSTTDLAVRTRMLNTGSGASVLLNNLWVGIFNSTNGECFGAAKYEDFNKTLQSGVIFNKLITVDFVAKSENLPRAFIVAIANYDGVTTHEGNYLSDILPETGNYSSISWDDLVKMDIDTESAYAGKKGEEENSNAPFLVGYYQTVTSLHQNPKIDQFTYDKSGVEALYPSTSRSAMEIYLGDEKDNNIYVGAGALCLRRLVVHNKVCINMSNGYEVIGVKYKRFNMPKVVYMLQRRTDTNKREDFQTWKKYSANRADYYMIEGNYNSNSSSFPYQNDSEWIEKEIITGDDTENVTFEFDHFENKHWGFGDIKTQEDREKLNPDGTYAALCMNQSDAYNNYASYFVLKLHIINKNTGESGEVEYTLHEGFCNDADGRVASTLEEKCYDFGSFRNVNYTYNINISGLNTITTNVTAKEGEIDEHPAGQIGSIWQMKYANSKSKTPIPIKGGEYNFGGQYMSFSDNPKLGFRIYGRDNKGKLIDICYNMPEGLYEGFQGLWSKGDPVFYNRLEDVEKALGTTTNNLLKDLKIGCLDSYYNIVDFVKGINNKTIESSGKFTLKFEEYKTSLSLNYLRGLYVFDWNDVHNSMDFDGCSTYKIAYGGEQYPYEFEEIKFNPANILWDNTYYKSVSSLPYVLTASTPIFYGAECSKIDLRWKHDERIIGYKISIYNDKYTHPLITIPASKLSDYLFDVNGDKVFIYALNTSDFPRSTGTGANDYNFAVTALVDPEMYKSGDAVHIIRDMNGDSSTCIRVCPTFWERSSTKDWKDINIALDATFEVHLRGLNLMSPTQKTESKYKNANYICLGGVGNASGRYFSFWASVPGKFEVTCNSHSTTDDTRLLVVARMSEDGSSTNSYGEKYDELYVSPTMPTSKSTLTTEELPLVNNSPTEFRIYARGSIDYYSIKFIPSY